MIAITGASGYIGVHLSHFLKDKKAEFKGIIKNGTSIDDITVLKKGSIPYELVDFFNEDSLYKALAGVDTIIHLIGSIYRPKNMSMENLHKDITATLMRAAKRRGVKKIIYVSALGSGTDAVSDYHKTKALAEEEIKRSNIPYVILRPSLIFGKLYGRRNSKLIARLAQSIQNLPFIPLIGSGKNKLQPLFIMDLVSCIEKSLSPSIKNITIELGGPKVMTLEEIAKTIARSLGHENKPVLRLPKPVAAGLAFVMERVCAQPKLTGDQLKMTGNDNICGSDTMKRYFDQELKSIHDELAHLV